MSVHGECFDNGQAGRCGYDCGMFKRGECEIGDEICELLVDFDWPEVLDAEIEDRVDPVTLFTMRGAGATKHELLMKAFGYYYEHME